GEQAHLAGAGVACGNRPPGSVAHLKAKRNERATVLYSARASCGRITPMKLFLVPLAAAIALTAAPASAQSPRTQYHPYGNGYLPGSYGGGWVRRPAGGWVGPPGGR